MPTIQKKTAKIELFEYWIYIEYIIYYNILTTRINWKIELLKISNTRKTQKTELIEISGVQKNLIESNVYYEFAEEYSSSTFPSNGNMN